MTTDTSADAAAISIDPEADRTVLPVTGADARAFLQDMVTNDLSRLDAGPVYAALLTPQGKYLADFIVVAAGDAVLLDVAAGLAEGLARRLSMYRLRRDVAIASGGRRVARGSGALPSGAVADPRHPAMGWRHYDPPAGTAASDGTDWAAARVAACVPASGIELVPDDSYILECGFERLNGVDFRKGCYVGQEVTARMKHKTELKKGLATVFVAGTAPAGTPILSDGRPAGTLFTQSGERGIAFLRFDRARGRTMSAGGFSVVWDG